MSTIFISHSSSDNDIARELEQLLERQGHTSVFLDLDPEKGIVAGVSWEQTLYRKLRACRAVIAICTDNHLKSHWCFAEIALARMEGKHIFAVIQDPLAADAKLPSILTEKQYIDLRLNRAEGLQRLWRGLHNIDALGVSTDWDPRQSPYLGLNAYQEKHAPVFFGREAETLAGLELLERGAPGLIMVLGASGTGKSSLVKAGILPRLRRDTDRWLIVDPMRPSLDPFFELARVLRQAAERYAPSIVSRMGETSALAERLKNWNRTVASAPLSMMDNDSSVSAPGTDPGTGTDTDKEHATDSAANPAQPDALGGDERVQRLLQQLEELHEAPPHSAASPLLDFLDWSLDDLRRICDNGVRSTLGGVERGVNPLLDIADELRRQSGVNARVLLVVDQFEELLGHIEFDHPANHFLQLLRASVELPDSPLMVLATMRSDYLGTFQHTAALHNIDFESLSLGPVNSESLRTIIEAPARLAAVDLEDGLSDLLIADTGTADALPLLSFTLWVLWRDYRQDGEIEIAEYQLLGGLHGAITREADALLEHADEALLREAFLQMARLSDEGQYARKQVAWDSAELRPVHAVLERFVDRRLLVVRGDAGERRIEVAHEALFRSWQPLRHWLDDNRSELLLKQEITREAASWAGNNKAADNLWRGARLQQASALLGQGKLAGDESEFVKRGISRSRWRLLAVLGIAFTVFAALATFSYQAVKSEQHARASQAEAVRDFLGLLNAMSGDEAIDILIPQEASRGRVDTTADVSKDQSLLFTDRRINDLMFAGKFQRGKVFAAAHDQVLNGQSPATQIMLKNVIRWMSQDTNTEKKRLLYSVGHCEVVGVGSGFEEYELPQSLFKKELGYSLDPIQDLSDLASLEQATALIIGNAWAAFSDDEIAAVRQYVEQGGGVIMTGLLWSWEQYKFSANFNPCQFEPVSKQDQLSRDTVNYPMTRMANELGIVWRARN